MAYSGQTFTIGQVLTAAQMSQVETNITDHVHGTDSVAVQHASLGGSDTHDHDGGDGNQIAHGSLSGAGLGTAGHVTNGNTHDHNGGDGGQIAHGSLSGAGEGTAGHVTNGDAHTHIPGTGDGGRISFEALESTLGGSYNLADGYGNGAMTSASWLKQLEWIIPSEGVIDCYLTLNRSGSGGNVHLKIYVNGVQRGTELIQTTSGTGTVNKTISLTQSDIDSGGLLQLYAYAYTSATNTYSMQIRTAGSAVPIRHKDY